MSNLGLCTFVRVDPSVLDNDRTSVASAVLSRLSPVLSGSSDGCARSIGSRRKNLILRCPYDMRCEKLLRLNEIDIVLARFTVTGMQQNVGRRNQKDVVCERGAVGGYRASKEGTEEWIQRHS